MKKSLYSLVILPAVMAAGLLMMSGCSISLGGGTQHHRHEYNQTTRGQELMDLEHAREEGIITESEYRLQRRKILDR